MTELVRHKVEPETLSVFDRAGVSVTDTQLTVETTNMSWEGFEELAVFIARLRNSSSFWLGDLLNAGEEIFGEEYAQVEASIRQRINPNTLKNVQSICRRVPKNRRRESVSFSHHQEVAPLPPNDQRHWLKVADEEDISKEELRLRIRAVRDGHPDVIDQQEPELCPTCHRPM